MVSLSTTCFGRLMSPPSGPLTEAEGGTSSRNCKQQPPMSDTRDVHTLCATLQNTIAVPCFHAVATAELFNHSDQCDTDFHHAPRQSVS